MVQIVNRKVVNTNGTPATRSGLYAFFVKMKNKESGELAGGGEQQHNGYYMGNQADAQKQADLLIKHYAEQYTDFEVKLVPFLIESVGPLLVDRMTELLQQVQVLSMSEAYLAQVISEKEIEASLELNPNAIGMDVRVQNVINNSRSFAQAQLEGRFSAAQAAASGVLDAEGNPVASAVAEIPASPDYVPSEQENADFARLDAEIEAAEISRLGRVIAFPGSAESLAQVEEPVLV